MKRASGGTTNGPRRVDIDGAAHLILRSNVTPLHPEEALFEAMLEGWSVQQRSRRLAQGTIEDRLRLIRRFAQFTNEFPWQWTPRDVEDWTVSLISGNRPMSHSTVRTYQQGLAMFLDYLCDARYGWQLECESRFGTYPVQVCHEWNTRQHLADYEGRPGNRPFTREELQTFFDYADEQVERVRKEGRKGWVAAFRDATLFKVAYAWGYDGGRWPASTSPISVPTPKPPGSAATGCSRSAGARPRGEVLPVGATSAR